MASADLQLAVELGRAALWVAVKVCLPILLAGLVVGAVVSVLQAATQIQDQTLSYVPKMLAVAATVFLLMPWLLAVLTEYTRSVATGMAFWFR
jgi:flagellar biosynthetic protein FliQ